MFGIELYFGFIMKRVDSYGFYWFRRRKLFKEGLSKVEYFGNLFFVNLVFTIFYVRN